MSKQRLLFITTGGTIASVRTQQGLKPVLTSEELLAHLPELKELCCPETLALCTVFSSYPAVYRPSQRPSLRLRMLPSPFARFFAMSVLPSFW